MIATAKAQKHSLLSEKIAVISHSHPSISKGGAEISAYALFRGLREIGFDAIYIGACSIADKRKLAYSSEHEYAVFFEPQKYSHFYHLADGDVERQLVSLLQMHGVGIINFHHFLHFGLNTLRAVRSMHGRRCYLTFHELLAICNHHGQMVTRPQHLLCSESSNEACGTCFPEHPRTRFVLRKNKMLESFGAFDGFISPSHFVNNRLVNWGLDGSRLAMIENGLLTHADGKDVRRATNDADEDEHESCVIGFFGQINPFKGVDLILDAADIISLDKALSTKIQLRIHGNIIGQSEAFVKRFDEACRKHSFLTYAGPYNTAVVAQLMSECDYILIPSKWWENSPLVVQEAYAVHVPIICTGIGGLAEKVPAGKSGLHFKFDDPQNLVQVIRKAIQKGMAEKLKAGIPGVVSAAEMAYNYASFFGLQR